jgi:hypothetical protein
MLMQRPQDVTVEDGHPAAFLWKSSSEAEYFYIVPASPTPCDVVRMHSLPPNFTTNRTGLFLNDLVGFFQAQGHQRMHVIFDTPPSLVGSSRDILTLALSLGGPGGPQSWLTQQGLPANLDGAKITWKAFLVYGQDRGDGQALTGYLHAAPPEEITTGVLHTVGRDSTASYVVPEDPRMRFFHRDEDIQSSWRNLKEMAPIITGILLDQNHMPDRIQTGKGGAS